jgi:hypothetical protein
MFQLKCGASGGTFSIQAIRASERGTCLRGRRFGTTEWLLDESIWQCVCVWKERWGFLLISKTWDYPYALQDHHANKTSVTIRNASVPVGRAGIDRGRTYGLGYEGVWRLLLGRIFNIAFVRAIHVRILTGHAVIYVSGIQCLLSEERGSASFARSALLPSRN